jgi:hypothetical protein
MRIEFQRIALPGGNLAMFVDLLLTLRLAFRSQLLQRLRGGAERTRTSNQAVMSRHRGLGGLELATKRLSAASSER